MEIQKPPARIVEPGRILKRELDVREWTQKDFSKITGRPEKTISAIIQGHKEITTETAIEFAAAFGTSPEFWNNLQSNYNLFMTLKSVEKKEITKKAKIYNLLPVKELTTRGYLKETSSVYTLEKEVCNFLEIDNLSQPPKLAASFRLSKAKIFDKPSQVAWLKIIEKNAKLIDCADFKMDKFKKALDGLRAFLRRPSKVSGIPEYLAKYGVRLVFEKAFRNTHIDGAVFYLNKKPVISLSLAKDRIDNFWFSLMHEIGHIILNHNTTFIDFFEEGWEASASPQERSANNFAESWLINKSDYSNFIKTSGPKFSKNNIFGFAHSLSIHPGLVIGRLQKDNLIPYSKLRNILEKVSPYCTF
jgi:HTH-type transcriptional regulator/antitoxin HigA